MEKCMYKCESEGICARSTCSHHCKQVNDETCSKCLLYQVRPYLSDKQILKQAIKNAITLLESNEIDQAKQMLNEVMGL